MIFPAISSYDLETTKSSFDLGESLSLMHLCRESPLTMRG